MSTLPTVCSVYHWSWHHAPRMARRVRGTTSLRLMLRARSVATISFRVPDRTDVAALQQVVPGGVIARSDLLDAPESSDVQRLDALSTDWMRKYYSPAPAAVLPTSSEQVSQVLRYCNERRIAVVPQGGNTGLVGGGVPVCGREIVLSTARMNKVVDFDAASGVLQAEAGCTLAALDAMVAEHGWTMPLDLGAKGSCHIGGNVSTNAGGLRLLRYGPLHGSVLGLRVVAADGRVLDMMSHLRKDNVGYDVKRMFIGSEGTLGVITHVAIQTAPRPSSVNVAMLGCDSFEAAVLIARAARRHLCEILSALEFVDDETMDVTLSTLARSLPFSSRSKFYVLVETAGSDVEHDQQKLDRFVEAVGGIPGSRDGIVARDSKQAAALWALREDASVAISQRGLTFKYDLSFAMPHMYDIVAVMRQRLERWRSTHDVRVCGYGHLGDGNVHLNISSPARKADFHQDLLAQIEPFVLEWTCGRRGSISAEHGVGQAKAAYMGMARPPAVLHVMQAMKAWMDPRGILNPGKVLATQRELDALRGIARDGSHELHPRP